MKIFVVLDLIRDPAVKATVLARFQELDRGSASGEHSLCFDDPTKADVFLFPTHGSEVEDTLGIPGHPLVKEAPERCFMWCDRDLPVPVLPGVYAALSSRSFDKRVHRTICYLSRSNPNIVPAIAVEGPLASFQGSRSSGLRARLFKMRFGPRIVIRETGTLWGGFIFGQGFRGDMAEVGSYAELMSASKFILCPKGNGLSSYRVFETLQAGRVPVIIADAYVPPDVSTPGPWLLRFPESRLNGLEPFLLDHEANFPVLAANARTVFAENFAEDRLAHFLGEQLKALRATSYVRDQTSAEAYFRRVRRAYRRSGLLTALKVRIGQLLFGWRR